MSIYGKIIRRLVLLSVVIAGAVMLGSRPAPAQELTCLEQCRLDQIICEDGCRGSSNINNCIVNCQVAATMCAKECS